uniref:Uncharacterized protein n=1 Tax=Rhizophora mucronata TaxID=61149 RepID=A0A2P2PZ74_RHIMU
MNSSHSQGTKPQNNTGNRTRNLQR